MSIQATNTSTIQTPDFRITSIVARTHDSSYGGYKWKVNVTIRIDAKVWSKYKKQDDLGHLYGVAISNEVFRLNDAIPASNPTVDDAARASKGVKLILFTYFLNDAERAAKLGLKVKTLRNGEVYAGFGDAVIVHKEAA